MLDWREGAVCVLVEEFEAEACKLVKSSVLGEGFSA